MLIKADSSALWVIDAQGKLMNQEHDWQRVLDSCLWITSVAKRLNIPILVSEQYPQGLGGTHEDLIEVLGDTPRMGKKIFSCVAAKCFDGMAHADTKQVVICGMEAHVCVLQTALDLKAQGREVFVIADAITSRSRLDVDLALARMRDAGITIVSREMVGFEWLRTAGTPEFKDFSINFLQ